MLTDVCPPVIRSLMISILMFVSATIGGIGPWLVGILIDFLTNANFCERAVATRLVLLGAIVSFFLISAALYLLAGLTLSRDIKKTQEFQQNHT